MTARIQDVQQLKRTRGTEKDIQRERQREREKEDGRE